MMRVLQFSVFASLVLRAGALSALPPTTLPADTDLLTHPNVILGNMLARDFTLNGVGIGDPEFRIPEGDIVTARNSGGWTECKHGAYRLERGRVVEILLKDAASLASMNVKSKADVEGVFGKPDRVLFDSIYYWDSRHRKAMWDEQKKSLTAIGVFDYEAARQKVIVPRNPDEESEWRALQAQERLEAKQQGQQLKAAFDIEAKEMAKRAERDTAPPPSELQAELERLRAENRVLRLELEAALEASRGNSTRSSRTQDGSSGEAGRMSKEGRDALEAKSADFQRIRDGIRQNRVVVGMTIDEVQGVLSNRSDLPVNKKERSDSAGPSGKVVKTERWWVKSNGHLGLLSFTDGKLDYMGD